MRRLLVAAFLALVAPSTASAAVERGTVLVNRGGAGVELGMKRATVVARLGQPVFQNANGYMQYAKTNLFDLYLDVGTKQVRLIGISGPRFCTARGICMFKRGAIRRLKAQYGGALRAVTDETGQALYVLRGRFRGKRVFTSFAVAQHSPTARIIQIFIGYCPPRPTTCGF